MQLKLKLFATIVIIAIISFVTISPFNLAQAAVTDGGMDINSYLYNNTSTSLSYGVDVDNNFNYNIILNQQHPLYIRPTAGKPKFILKTGSTYNFSISGNVPGYWSWGSDSYGQYIAVFPQTGYIPGYGQYQITVNLNMQSASYGSGTYTWAAGVNTFDTAGNSHFLTDYESINR